MEEARVWVNTTISQKRDAQGAGHRSAKTATAVRAVAMLPPSPYAVMMSEATTGMMTTTTTITTMAIITIMTAAETSVEAAAMAAANATAMAAATLVVAAMAIACKDCVEGDCIGDVAAAAVTVASTMVVKAAAR